MPIVFISLSHHYLCFSVSYSVASKIGCCCCANFVAYQLMSQLINYKLRTKIVVVYLFPFRRRTPIDQRPTDNEKFLIIYVWHPIQQSDNDASKTVNKCRFKQTTRKTTHLFNRKKEYKKKAINYCFILQWYRFFNVKANNVNGKHI